jgi:outer membrane protein
MKTLLTSVALIALTAGSAFAAGDTKAPSSDFKAGDILIRARALGVVPDESSSMSIADEVKLSNSYVPEIDATYFFTPNVAAEVIAAVTPHNVSTTGGVDAGDVWLLPPTVTLQYHFTQLKGVKPYVGAGINYTHFYNADPGVLGDVKYSDSWGGALQAGADFPLGNNWYANVDVKKLYIDTTAKFSNDTIRADVDIDPWVIGMGVGYKF